MIFDVAHTCGNSRTIFLYKLASSGMIILLKEHPADFFLRNCASFSLLRLLRFPSLFLMDCFTFSFLLLVLAEPAPGCLLFESFKRNTKNKTNFSNENTKRSCEESDGRLKKRKGSSTSQQRRAQTFRDVYPRCPIFLHSLLDARCCFFSSPPLYSRSTEGKKKLSELKE